METFFAILMFIAYLSGDEGVYDRATNACDKPYVCKYSQPDTKSCLKEAIDYQMENCLRR